MNSRRILILLSIVVVVGTSTLPCGTLTKAYGTIRGGVEAERGAWPWIASIRLSANSGREHICAGTLVGKKFIITAAHCVMTRRKTIRKPSDLLVIVGTQTLDAPYTTSKESVLRVKTVHVHPKYLAPGIRPWAYDLAIIQLYQAPYYEDVSRPACLPLDNVPPSDGESCLIAGWGKTETSRFSRVLMQASVPIVSKRECNKRTFWDGYIDDSMLCALSKTTGRASSCQGDSGGPLLCERKGQFYLYGVISWGPIICGDKPGVFTNIAHVADWMLGIVEVAGEDIDPGSALNDPDMRKSRLSAAARRTSSSENRFRPPCDAVQFERKHGYVIYGPAPRGYQLTDVTIRQCMTACCKRGASQCQSFVYYHTHKKCQLRMVTRCDRNADFKSQTSARASSEGPVTYYGKKECR